MQSGLLVAAATLFFAACSGGTGDAGTLGFGAVGSGNGITVAVSGKNVFVSNNGGVDGSAPQQLAANIDRVVYTGQQFVAIGSGHAFTSVDATQWVDHPVSNLGGGLACHTGICVVVSDHRAFRSSDHGASWVPITFDAGTAQDIEAITWGSW